MKKATLYILISILTLGLIIGIPIAIKYFIYPVHTINNSMNMAYEITDKTMNGDNAIYNYEWFKRQYESIESLNKKQVDAERALEDLKDMLSPNRSDWSRDDKVEYDRLSAVVMGLKNQLNDAVAEYNARSNMVNRAIFKENLPTNITEAILQGLRFTK